MAKQRHQETQDSKAPLAILAAGALIVAALVIWALTRTVEPASTSVVETAGSTAVPPPAPTATLATDSASTVMTTSPSPSPSPSPIASTTAPITATSTTPPPAIPQGDKSAVHRIAAEDLREKMKGGNVTVIDVRDNRSYEAAHIAGAIHIPLASIQSNLDLIPKGKEVITYCT